MMPIILFVNMRCNKRIYLPAARSGIRTDRFIFAARYVIAAIFIYGFSATQSAFISYAIGTSSSAYLLVCCTEQYLAAYTLLLTHLIFSSTLLHCQ